MTDRDGVMEVLSETGALMAEGFEDALIGYSQQFNKTVALYDYERCIRILMKRDGMIWEEAVEFFEFNVQGAWVGESIPAFATLITA